MMENESAALLAGIKIIDFTRYFPGPFATLRLLEAGAEVIKVEEPTGDPARFMDTLDGEEGCIFRSQSRGKRSLAVNLKAAAGLRTVLALVAGADVVVEGFRPGVAKRLGIDCESLQKVNDHLVYCSLSGYGQNTSIAHLAGHDLNYMAYSGLLAQLTDASGAPVKPDIALADMLGGMAAGEAILMGLVKRARTGQGSYIDASLTDGALSLLGLHVCHASATGETHGINNDYIAYGIYETKDRRYMTLGAIEEKFWQNFCAGAERADLIAGHKTLPKPENPYYQALVALLKSRTLGEWSEFALRVDCCMAPVLGAEELRTHFYVKERGLLRHKWGLDYLATRYWDGEDFLHHADAYPKLGEMNRMKEEI